MDRNGLKGTEIDRNGQEQTQAATTRQKRTEVDINRQKGIEKGKKLTKTDRNRLNQTKMKKTEIY